jgi:hypothetical protein
MLKRMDSRGKCWSLAKELVAIHKRQLAWEAPDPPAVITPPAEITAPDAVDLTAEGHNGTAFPQMEPEAAIFPEDWQHTGRTIF